MYSCPYKRATQSFQLSSIFPIYFDAKFSANAAMSFLCIGGVMRVTFSPVNFRSITYCSLSMFYCIHIRSLIEQNRAVCCLILSIAACRKHKHKLQLLCLQCNRLTLTKFSEVIKVKRRDQTPQERWHFCGATGTEIGWCEQREWVQTGCRQCFRSDSSFWLCWWRCVPRSEPSTPICTSPASTLDLEEHVGVWLVPAWYSAVAGADRGSSWNQPQETTTAAEIPIYQAHRHMSFSSENPDPRPRPPLYAPPP